MQSFTLITITSLALLAPFCAAGKSEYNSENEIDGSTVLERAYSRPVERCVSTSDCKRNECSVLGMQRYSEPRCEPMSGIGAPCRPGVLEGEKKTLHFPHMVMECDDVYLQFCPCASGLFCQEGQCQALEKRTTTQKPDGYPWTFGRLH